MIYKRKNLQRLWEVLVYTGDRNEKNAKTKKETVIAWNAVDVARKIGDRIAEPPVELGHVFLDETNQYRMIEDTSGPTNKVAKPSIKPDE